MNKFIGGLVLVILLGITVFLTFAQQNQNTQKPNPEIEVLKNRISVLESKLQTVENVKKMELLTKLAEANAKLANAEFGKLERNLRDSNQKWLIGWILFFLTVLAVVGTPLWLLLKSGVNRIITNLKSNADQLIADEVEKSLNGFKDALAQVNTLKKELSILRKEQAASMFEVTFQPDFGSELGYPRENEARRKEALKELSEETLLDIFEDKKYLLAVRHRAAEILAQKSPPLVMPLLELLNSAIDPDSDTVAKIGEYRLRNSVALLVEIEVPETYEGLTKFLNRLLTENPEHKDLFLTWTVYSLAYISIKLNKRESASILRRTIPYLNVSLNEDQALKNLARLFDIFSEPTGIKEILIYHAADRMPEVETRCLELLEKHDPEFIEKWKVKKESANTQNEESE